jgi:hypothetical protein
MLPVGIIKKYKFAVLPRIEGTLQNRLSNMDEIVEKKIQNFFSLPSRKTKILTNF